MGTRAWEGAGIGGLLGAYFADDIYIGLAKKPEALKYKDHYGTSIITFLPKNL